MREKKKNKKYIFLNSLIHNEDIDDKDDVNQT